MNENTTVNKVTAVYNDIKTSSQLVQQFIDQLEPLDADDRIKIVRAVVAFFDLSGQFD